MHDHLILSHNLGTNGNNAVIYRTDGTIISSWFTPYAASYRSGGRVEQNPNDWWDAVCVSTKKVLRGLNVKELSVVSFSGQMMGVTCLDKAGDPVRSSLIWADIRATKEAAYLREQIDENLFYNITGHRISSAYPASKLFWLKNHERDAYNKTAKILQAKDYIVYKLTGEIVSDYSDASGSNLFNIRKRKWSRTILSILGISEDILPEIVPSTTVVGTVTFDAAAATGLLPGTPVVIGAGDGIAATIAGGSTTEKEAYLYYGSSAWIGFVSSRVFLDKEKRTFNWNYIDDRLFVPCGTMQTAGIALDWIRDKIALEESSQAKNLNCIPQDVIIQKAASSPVGSNGVIFLPHFEGERSPYWDPYAKGVFIGLTADVSRNDLFRACYEGVALNLRLIWDALRASTPAEQLTMIGGQACSQFNRQIIADALNIKVVTNNHTKDSKNFGAAILGGLGIGIYDSVNVTGKLLRQETETLPEPAHAGFYNRLLPVFDEAYRSNAPVCRKLSELRAVEVQDV